MARVSAAALEAAQVRVRDLESRIRELEALRRADANALKAAELGAELRVRKEFDKQIQSYEGLPSQNELLRELRDEADLRLNEVLAENRRITLDVELQQAANRQLVQQNRDLTVQLESERTSHRFTKASYERVNTQLTQQRTSLRAAYDQIRDQQLFINEMKHQMDHMVEVDDAGSDR